MEFLKKKLLNDYHSDISEEKLNVSTLELNLFPIYIQNERYLNIKSKGLWHGHVKPKLG